MSDHADTSTFFGLSRVVETELRASLADFLRTAWEVQHGRPPGDLDADLMALRQVFRPDVSGAALRNAAASLEPVPAPRSSMVGDALFVVVDDRRGFVTPEGRLALELLDSYPPGRLSISDSDLLRAALTLARFYGEPVRSHVAKTVARPDLRPLSFAFALLLLINGSIGEDRALRTPSSRDEERRLMQAIAPVLNAFSEGIGGGSLSSREAQRMEGNWALTEVARQLPTMAARTKAGFWIRPAAAEGAGRRVGELLARRKNPPTRAQLMSALDAVGSAYRVARPALAALNMAHDRPHRTEQLFTDVAIGFDEAARGAAA
jgi:hypothetical protein